MGRFYSGDIEGKFAFGNQPSTDVEYFGAVEQEPCDIPYEIDIDKKELVLKKLTELIQTFNKLDDTKITIEMNEDEFWSRINDDRYQKSGYRLLVGRIAIGLNILRFWDENPDDNIYFDAEV